MERLLRGSRGLGIRCSQASFGHIRRENDILGDPTLSRVESY